MVLVPDERRAKINDPSYGKIEQKKDDPHKTTKSAE